MKSERDNTRSALTRENVERFASELRSYADDEARLSVALADAWLERNDAHAYALGVLLEREDVERILWDVAGAVEAFKPSTGVKTVLHEFAVATLRAAVKETIRRMKERV